MALFREILFQSMYGYVCVHGCGWIHSYMKFIAYTYHSKECGQNSTKSYDIIFLWFWLKYELFSSMNMAQSCLS